MTLRVQPRASRNKVLGTHGGALKIALNAPPVDGAANKACLDLLAEVLGIKMASIEIKHGQKSRNKQILLREISIQQVQERLKEILSNGRNYRME